MSKMVNAIVCLKTIVGINQSFFDNGGEVVFVSCYNRKDYEVAQWGDNTLKIIIPENSFNDNIDYVIKNKKQLKRVVRKLIKKINKKEIKKEIVKKEIERILNCFE